MYISCKYKNLLQLPPYNTESALTYLQVQMEELNKTNPIICDIYGVIGI